MTIYFRVNKPKGSYRVAKRISGRILNNRTNKLQSLTDGLIISFNFIMLTRIYILGGYSIVFFFLCGVGARSVDALAYPANGLHAPTPYFPSVAQSENPKMKTIV